MKLVDRARKDLERLSRNSFLGSGLLFGIDKSGENLVLAVWHMGASESVQPHMLVKGDDWRVRLAEAGLGGARPATGKILFPMMDEGDVGTHVLGNRSHVRILADPYCEEGEVRSVRCPRSAAEILLEAEETYALDDVSTPLIAARCFIHCEPPVVDAEAVVFKRTAWQNEEEGYEEHADENHEFLFSGLLLGFAHCISTYSGEGDREPFRGEPLLIPLEGGIKEISSTLWQLLAKVNDISLAVKTVNRKYGYREIVVINHVTEMRQLDFPTLAPVG